MEALQALGDWPVAVWLRQPGMAYPLLNAAHILSLGLLFGAIATLDLKLLGLFRHHPLPGLAPPLMRVAATGLVLTLATGFLLFSVRPPEYAQNPAFLAKMGLLALAIVNLAVLHMTRPWRHALDGGRISPALKILALVSLAVWTGAIIAGRMIGFTG